MYDNNGMVCLVTPGGQPRSSWTAISGKSWGKVVREELAGEFVLILLLSLFNASSDTFPSPRHPCQPARSSSSSSLTAGPEYETAVGKIMAIRIKEVSLCLLLFDVMFLSMPLLLLSE